MWSFQIWSWISNSRRNFTPNRMSTSWFLVKSLQITCFEFHGILTKDGVNLRSQPLRTWNSTQQPKSFIMLSKYLAVWELETVSWSSLISGFWRHPSLSWSRWTHQAVPSRQVHPTPAGFDQHHRPTQVWCKWIPPMPGQTHWGREGLGA